MMNPPRLGLLLILGLVAATAAPARAWEFDYGRRGLELEFESVPVELRLGGRLHLDFGEFDADLTRGEDDFDVRRGRLYLAGRVDEDWRFKVEYDFASAAGNAGGGAGWRNAWLQWSFHEDASLRVGNFVVPFGLESVGSSNYLTFLERGLSNALTPGFQTGVGLGVKGSEKHRFGRLRWTGAAAGYVESFGDSDLDLHKSEHGGFATRWTVAPLSDPRRLLHLGVSVEYRDLRGGSGYRIRSRPESSLAPALFSTGTLGGVDDVLSVGTEAAAGFGPFSLQGEYVRSMLQRSGSGRSDADFDAWYVQASWILTGENRRYGRTSGTFSGVRPERKWGAVEFALRYSGIDLVDAGIAGGDGNDLTVGANWYLGRNVRLMFNYVRVDSDQRGTGLDDDPDVFQGRLLVFF